VTISENDNNDDNSLKSYHMLEITDKTAALHNYINKADIITVFEKNRYWDYGLSKRAFAMRWETESEIFLN